jgi:predicted TIM-barrel fold metal-dependent hydrolase
LQETGKPLGFHAGYYWADEWTKQINQFGAMHALSFVWCNVVHMTNWVWNGLCEKFPDLDVLWIESGLAWVPWLMQRLDHTYLMRTSEAPLLKRLPSEYMREMYFTSQPLETDHMKALELTCDMIDAPNKLLYASDWPHWDFDTPSVIWDLPFLDEQAKRNILGLNAAKLFGLDVPAKLRR